MKKDESKLTGIFYFCDELKKEIVLKDDISSRKYSISATSQECDMCGSHGSVTMYVDCECGKTHDIEINSW